jgi:LPS export ABC transporter protein LptC
MKKYNLYLIAVLLVIAGCKAEKTADTAVVPVIKQTIEKFSISETKSGKPNWVLDADVADIFESEKRILLQKPDIKFYNEGVYASNLKAFSGRINTETYDIWGDSGCVLTTTKGETLITSNLHYRSDIKKIVTDENIKLIKPDEVIYGKGMEATPDLKSIIIKKQMVEMEGNK